MAELILTDVNIDGKLAEIVSITKSVFEFFYSRQDTSSINSMKRSFLSNAELGLIFSLKCGSCYVK